MWRFTARHFLLATLLLVLTARGSAHPLGNFTINHLAKISASHATLQVRYILDIAEIPTFQIMHQADSAPWTARVTQQWADGEVNVVQSGFHLTVNGAPAALQLTSARASFRPGAGGLPILRWVGIFVTPLTAHVDNHVTARDDVYADRRIGWKDIIVGSQREPTDELRRYPSALIGTPRRVNDVAFTIGRSGAITNVAQQTDSAPLPGTLSSWISPAALSDMFSRPSQTPFFVMLTLLAAFGLGALHAIEPGHGKALLAFTLVGARATTRQAFILAGSLTFAHTAGVMLLGVVLFFAARFVSESIYPWITLTSGVIIAAIGARSLGRFVAARRAISHTHTHEHTGAHPHSHEHSHDDPESHGHAHTIPGSAPLKFRTAVIAAMTGGIAPCPAAIVVLLAALRLHEIGYGMVLIVVFSMGLAFVLSGLGIGVVHGAAWLSRRSAYARLAPYGPLVTAMVISVIGALTLASGLVQQGFQAPSPLLAALVLAAIAGFAFAQHGHTHELRTVREAEAA